VAKGGQPSGSGTSRSGPARGSGKHAGHGGGRR
jgi:hypothetical protein